MARFIRNYWPLIAVVLLLVPVAAIYLILWQSAASQKIKSTGLIEISDGKDVSKSLNVPEEKYPHGFPIEILDKQTYFKKDGHKAVAGYCRWHPDTDPILGGKVAIVPVVLYEMNFKTKELVAVVETITRRKDGFFVLPIPANDKDYSVGLKIERAENCPPQFKHSRKARKKRQEL